MGYAKRHTGWRNALDPPRHKAKRAQPRNIRKRLREKLDLRDLWEQERGVCWICRLPVPWVKRGLHGNRRSIGPSRDHKVPIRDGGTNCRDNIALAHGTCNTRRRKGVPVHEIIGAIYNLNRQQDIELFECVVEKERAKWLRKILRESVRK